MITRSHHVISLACLLTISWFTSSAHAQYDQLLKYVPESVNTVVLLNAEKVLNSEIALAEGWRTHFEKSIGAGLTRLPADAKLHVMASQTDFAYMHPVWEVGILTTEKAHDMVYIARERKGKQDTIAGLPAVLMPADNYLIQIDPNTYATLIPGSRQAVSRWMNATTDAAPEFSPYISEAIRYATDLGTEIIMAMDLTDAVDLDDVRTVTKESKSLKDAVVDPEAAAKVLASIRGVTLGITFGRKSFGSIKVDFAEDASVLRNVGVQLLADVMAKHGATIDDFAKWTGKVDGKELRFSGDLSASGLRQIFSLISPPTTAAIASTPESESDPSAQDQDPTVVATQQYFTSVEEYGRDIRAKEPQRISQYGIWFDKYARKIDQLPMVNVDPEMLDYGAYVAQQFRNAGSAIQGIGVRKRVRQVSNVNSASGPSYWGSGYDGRGYYNNGNYVVGAAASRGLNSFNYSYQAGLHQQQRVRTQVNVEEKARGTSMARAIVKDLERASAEMRRHMTEKYNVEFSGR